MFVTSQLSLQLQACLENPPFRSRFSLFILQSYKLDMYPFMFSHTYQVKTQGFRHVVDEVNFLSKIYQQLEMSGDDVKTVPAPHSPGPFLWFYSHRFLFKKAP